MIETTSHPNAFIFAGSNASGKSTLIAHLLGHRLISGEFINPDLILKEELMLPETVENYRIAFQIAETRRYDLLAEKRDLIVETVFSTPEKITFVQALQKSGYTITLFFVGTETPHINARYLVDRILKGGHDVPVSKMIARRLRGFENIKAAMPQIDRLIFMDNSLYGEPPQIVRSYRSAEPSFEAPLWEREERACGWLQKIVELNSGKHAVVGERGQHHDFCLDVQRSTEDFMATSRLTYSEKNQILTGTKLD